MGRILIWQGESDIAEFLHIENEVYHATGRSWAVAIG